MDREQPELIERQMEQTRESLTEKVSLLENKVVGQIQQASDSVQGTVDSVQDTVQSVKTSVQDTVETLKSAVQDTVQSVSETVKGSVQSLTAGIGDALDVRRHTQENPWAMVGSATVAGFVTGLLVFRRPPSGGSLPAYTPMPASSYSAPVAAAPSHRPGWLNDLLDLAGREVKKIAEQAIARASASLKQNVEERIPKLIDNALPAAMTGGSGHGGDGAAAGHYGNGASAYGGPTGAGPGMRR